MPMSSGQADTDLGASRATKEQHQLSDGSLLFPTVPYQNPASLEQRMPASAGNHSCAKTAWVACGLRA